MSNDRQLTGSTNRLMSLLSCNKMSGTPETINVFTKAKTWQTWSVSDYETHFNTTLTHGVVCDQRHEPLLAQLQAHMATVEDDYPRDREALTAFIKNPVNYFNLTHVSDNYGYRTIASRSIPAGTIIGIYSAELLLLKDGDDAGPTTEDDMGVSGHASAVIIEGVNYKLRFRATAVGDLTRHALHAPDLARVAYLENHGLLAHEVEWKNILRANVTYHQAICNDIPVCYFKTREDIAQNAFIKINWGTFWQASDMCAVPRHCLPKYNREEAMPTLFMRTTSAANLVKLKFSHDKYQLSGASAVNVPTTGPDEEKDDNRVTPQR